MIISFAFYVLPFFCSITAKSVLLRTSMLQLLFGLNVFCVLLSVVLHGSPHRKSTCYYEPICAIWNVFMWLCVCVFEGEKEWEREGDGEGFIALFFYARDGMNLSVCMCVCVCVCVCVWMNVDETEKAALCIAVHHRQYPCSSSIHIHTPFSYPLQKQGEKVQMYLSVQQRKIWVKRNTGKETEAKRKLKF